MDAVVRTAAIASRTVIASYGMKASSELQDSRVPGSYKMCALPPFLHEQKLHSLLGYPCGHTYEWKTCLRVETGRQGKRETGRQRDREKS